MTRIVDRLIARGNECARDVGRGGFSGFMAGVQHGLEIARRDPAAVDEIAGALRSELLRAATPAEIAWAKQETDRAVTKILETGGPVQ